MNKRCAWVSDSSLYQAYHDDEWGVPVYDDKRLFEFIILEGQQAGLNWVTILKKREHYRQVLHGFDALKIAQQFEKEKASLLADPGIIRNRLKIDAINKNARAYLTQQETGESFSDFLWNFVDGQPIINHWQDTKEIPASNELSERLSKALKKKGFSFVGPTICYAFMQAVGMVMDHTTDCYRYPQLTKKPA